LSGENVVFIRYAQDCDRGWPIVALRQKLDVNGGKEHSGIRRSK